MSSRVHGFPDRFPVRSDGIRPFRYRLTSLFSRVLLWALCGRSRLVIEGEENVPAEGPLLIASNHLSNVDPLVYGGHGPGALFAMAKRELFPNRLLAWWWAGCNVFPIDRQGSDRQALRTALHLLAQRQRLLVFVEGTRAGTAGMRRAEAGLGFLARRSGAPVLPVAIWGTEKLFFSGARWPRRATVHVRYGQVVTLPSVSGRTADTDQRIADDVAQRIAALLPAAYRGVYQGTKSKL